MHLPWRCARRVREEGECIGRGGWVCSVVGHCHGCLVGMVDGRLGGLVKSRGQSADELSSRDVDQYIYFLGGVQQSI